MTNYASTDAGFKIAPYLRILHEALQLDEDNVIDKFRGVYGVKVKRKDGVEGFWIVNLKKGKGTVEFNSKTQPEVIFNMDDEDIVSLANLDITPQKAFFSGKIKVQGNMEVALKLARLPLLIKPKLQNVISKL